MWAGRVSAHHVNRLIEHLTIMPSSRIFALEQGDLGWMGWDDNTRIAASTHNHIVALLCGLSKTDPEPFLIRSPGETDEAVETEITYPTIAEMIRALETNGPAAQFLKG